MNWTIFWMVIAGVAIFVAGFWFGMVYMYKICASIMGKKPYEAYMQHKKTKETT